MSAFLTKILFIVCSILIDVASLNVETRCEHKDLKVFLIDNLLQGNEISWLNEYVRSQKPWILNQVDDSEDSSLDVKSNTTWISPISKDMLESTRIWNELSMVVKNLTGSKPLLCYAMFTLTYRMDFKPVSRIDNGLMVHIFLNKDMKKNDYGEAVFYDHDNVMCGIHERPGRVLIWNSSIPHVTKPPSMHYKQTQSSIVMKLTYSDEEYQNCMELNKAQHWQPKLNSRPQSFPFTGENNKLDCFMKGDINYTNHLTNKYYDSQGREIAVFDNVLSQGDLSRLREYLVHDYSTFGFQPYDDERKEDHDNVAWISVQKSDVLVQSGLWQVVKQAAMFLSGLDQWYPYDVSMNIVHSFHHTRIHEDCEHYEHEYTFVLYLNKEWHENLYGETVYFEQVRKDTQPGDEEYEIIAAVRPRYGRIVMFRGIIPHSARPPAPGFHGARYTFACKVSKTYRSARVKKLRETMEALQNFGFEETDEVELPDDFESNIRQSAELVDLELSRQKQILENLIKERQEYLLNALSGAT